MKNELDNGAYAWLINLVTITAFLFVLIPVVLVASVKFINPPVSAFMLGYEMSDNTQTLKFDWRDLHEISSSMPVAAMAAEDQRFMQHYGFDVEEIRRAWIDYKDGNPLRGASTISQQTAKNLFLWSDRSFVRKGLESWFTVLMEVMLSKERILELYLNVAEFAPGVYGVEAASQKFFFKPASDLTDKQAALLAAVLPSPKHYQVDHPSAYVQQRQRWILQQMRVLNQNTALNLVAAHFESYPLSK